MRKRILTLVLLMPLAASGAGFAACQPPDRYRIPDAKLAPQELDLWCWAACEKMVVALVGEDIEECQIVIRKLGTPCCGLSKKTNKACNHGGRPDFTAYPSHNLHPSQTGGHPVDWEILKENIFCRQSPVIGEWKPKGSTIGHEFMVIGYVDDPSEQSVTVMDPSPVNRGRVCTLSKSAYDKGSTYDHGNDIYNIRP